MVEEQTLAKKAAAPLRRCRDSRRACRALGNRTRRVGRLGDLSLSGWQVAADANLAGHTYPDQSLYPANSVPAVVRRINNAMIRADQIAWANGENRDRPGALIVPIVADAEAGFGGPLNAFELMKQMIVAGAAGVHWEDQLASRESAAISAARYSFPPDSTSGLSTPLGWRPTSWAPKP